MNKKQKKALKAVESILDELVESQNYQDLEAFLSRISSVMTDSMTKMLQNTSENVFPGTVH